MPKFVRKPVLPEVVEAMQLQVPFVAGALKGEVGDWLVQGSDGVLRVMKDEEFKTAYQEKLEISWPKFPELPELSRLPQFPWGQTWITNNAEPKY